MNEAMLAWQSGDPGVNALVLSEIAIPEPAVGELLVEVEVAALNFSDILMVEDKYQVRPKRPFVPGQELVGVVRKAGPDSRFRIGARIASEVVGGGFAHFAVVREDMTIEVPPEMPATVAAALPVVYTTAMIALTECSRIKEGTTVLVLAAAGGVGLAAVQIAKALGAFVIAAAGTEEKRRLASQNGADACVDYRQDGWAELVKSLTGDRGADIVVDPVGGRATEESLRCLAWGGTLLVVGFSSGEIPLIPANRLLLKRASAVGVYWNHDRDAEMVRRVTERLFEMIRRGVINPVVDDRFAFSELPAALRHLALGQSSGKLVLKIAHAASQGEMS